MASLPAPKTKSSLPAPTTAYKTKVAQLLVQGHTVYQIAKRVSNGDKRLASQLRNRIYYMAGSDEEFQRIFATVLRGKASAEGLPTAVAGQIKRSQRGRTDAAKLIMELTGFHNPKVSHEHSGDINIKLSLPRPELPEDADQPQVVDAEVVED